MKIHFFAWAAWAVILSGMILGCASTGVGFSPSNKDFGGGANMKTNVTSPQPGQVFPSGQDVSIEAVAWDVSGVDQVIILVNNKQIAKDSSPPYTAVLSKPAPGQYEIQSYATNKYGDTMLSSVITITVK